MLEPLLLAVLLGTGAGAGAAPKPFEVTVPKNGMSSATRVQTPAGPLTFSFQGVTRGLNVTIGSGSPPASAALQGAAIELSPVFQSGKLATRFFKGERWKCVSPSEGEWIAESHDDLLTSRLELEPDALQRGPALVMASLRGAVSPSTDRLLLRVLFPKAPPVVFQLRLESPLVLPPAVAEMLKQYQKVGPAAEATEKPWNQEARFFRVVKDECGDTRMVEELFDASALQTLAYPSHDWRLMTAHGWVFAEPIQSHREEPVPPTIDFHRLDLKNMTWLGAPYWRHLKSVDTSPGKATATFELGDFSGCFGAGCGTPVDTREAAVTLANGTLSTRIVRTEPE